MRIKGIDVARAAARWIQRILGVSLPMAAASGLRIRRGRARNGVMAMTHSLNQREEAAVNLSITEDGSGVEPDAKRAAA